jgi:putative endonuclease
MAMYYVYIIKSKKNSRLYTGYSSNLKQRMADHSSGKSAYTRNLKPWSLVYYEAYISKLDAKHREESLKLRSNANMQLRKRIKNSINEG